MEGNTAPQFAIQKRPPHFGGCLRQSVDRACEVPEKCIVAHRTNHDSLKSSD